MIKITFKNQDHCTYMYFVYHTQSWQNINCPLIDDSSTSNYAGETIQMNFRYNSQTERHFQKHIGQTALDFIVQECVCDWLATDPVHGTFSLLLHVSKKKKTFVKVRQKCKKMSMICSRKCIEFLSREWVSMHVLVLRLPPTSPKHSLRSILYCP